MSKRQETIVFNLQANVEQIKQSASEINSVFSKLNLPQSVQTSFSKTFNKLTEDIRTFEAQAGKGFKNLADTKKAEKNIETIVTDFEKLRVQIKDVKGFPADKLLPKEVLNRIKQYKDLLGKANKLTLKDNSSGINRATEAVKRAQQKFDDNEQSIKKNNAAIQDNENRYKELSQYISDAEKSLKDLVARREELKNKKNKTTEEATEYAILDTRIKAVKSSLTSYNRELINNEANGKKLQETQGQLSVSAVTLQENLNKANQELTNIKNSSAVTDSELQNLKQSLANIANVDPGTLPETLQGLITRIQKLSADASNIDAIKNALGELESKLHSGADGAQQFGQTFHNTTTQSVEDIVRANSEMDQLKTRLTYFFSAMNGVQLFKRAIRSAYESVKELDAAITEMAVVTDYSINDIWGNIPEYTRTATELGATTKDVIKSMVLYTQQGLDMSQATELSTQTMKMARIAGLEGAEATDLMTAALRGFNMELNEASAKRVNDVYSNLAANAAANTHEIADAMTRTASIANAAGMEFETTAAFLTQMIETTRESAENLGTAMKTIVARFTEMKKAPTGIVEVEGEEVDVNKVETALKSVGVQLRDTTGQFRDLDDVFLELSSKWDSLDKMSQRYVATTAAGSRQQSRFIAMMSNYQRTMELTGYATNSAGASQKQFEKTMDSLESKLNRLHDAWEQYVTGIANQSIIKGVVDLLTNLLTTVNNITDALDPFHTGWSKILAAFLGFKTAKGVVNGVLKGIGTQLGTRSKTSLDEKQGTVDGTKYGKGFWGAFQKMQAQKRSGTMPLNEETKATKEAMKAQDMSTKKFTLTGKDTQAAKVFRDQSKALKEQSDAAGKLSTKYKDYSDSIQKASTASKNGKKAIDKNRESLRSLNTQLQKEEEAYRSTLQVGTAEYESSVARSKALGEEAQRIQKAQNIQELKNVSTNAGTTANNLNTTSEELNEKAKQANTTATILEGKALDVENIKQQASNMTKGQALLGLFSLNKEKRLAAAVTLGLASTEEVQAMATKGAAGAQSAFNAALYSCPIMWIIAAVAALTAALVVLAVWQHKTAEAAEKENKAKLEGVKKATEEATEAAKEAKEAYDDLLENKNTYNQLQKELRTLVEGSDEYNKKLKETKELIDGVVESNSEIAKYVTYDSNGKPSISPEGWALAEKTKKEKAYQAELAKGITDVNSAYETYLNTISGDEYYLSRENLKFKNGKNASDQLDYSNTHYKPEDGAGLSTEYYKQVGRYRISKDITTEKTDKNTIKVGKYYMSETAYNDLSQLVGQVNDAGRHNAYGKDDMGMSTKDYNIVRWNNKLTGAEENNRSGTSGGVSSFGISMTIDDSSLETAVNQVFKQGQQAFDTFSEKVKYTYSSALMDGISNLEGASPSQANAFAKYYAQRLIDSGEATQTIEDFGDVYKSYFKKGEKELESAYKAKFGKFEPEEVGLDTNNEEYKTEKQSYMAARLAGQESFSKQVEADVKVYEKLMKGHATAFGNVLTVLSKDFDDTISDTLLNSLLTTADAADFLNDEYNKVISEMKVGSDQFQAAWTTARADVQEKIYAGIELFNKDKVSQLENGTGKKVNLDFASMLQQRIGSKALFDFGYLAQAWQEQIKKLSSTIYGADTNNIEFDTANLLAPILNTDLMKDAKSAEETYKKLSEIDLSNPIKAAKTIDELSKSTNENYAKSGNTLKQTTKEWTSLSRQVQYAWKSIDSDTMSDLFKDGTATTEEIRKLSKTLPDLANLLDLNSISASTLAKYFNEVQSGMLNIETTSASFVSALDKINKAQNLIDDSMDYINNFKASTSQQTITDNLSKWRDSMKQSLERGQYGDQNLQDYAKAILGLDNWNKYYTEFDGNLQKIEELAFSKINLWKDNFYDLWADFAGKSNTVNLGNSGEISFDLSNITSVDDLKQQLMKTYGFSEEIAEAAIADAQTYSSELSKALKQLSLGDSIQTLLEGGVQDDITKTVNLSKRELEILASEAGMEFNDLVGSINKTLNENLKGWTVDYSDFLDENGQLTEKSIKKYNDQIKANLVVPTAATTKKISNKDMRISSLNLDDIYSEMLSKGMKPDQIKTQMQSLLKEATKDIATGDKNVFYYFKDGVLKAYTGALEDKSAIAKSLGVTEDMIYTSIDDAVAGGMLDGLQDKKVRAQKDLEALDTLQNTALAVSLGYKLGMMSAEEVNAAVANDLYNQVNGALTSALKSRRDELNSILNSSSKLNVGNFSSEYNKNKLGQYGAYATKISREGWSKNDKSNSDSDSDKKSTKDTTSTWTNDWDRQYAVLKKIESLERERNSLSKEQQRFLKTGLLNEKKILKTKEDQRRNLTQQIKLNEDLVKDADAWLRRMNNDGKFDGAIWWDDEHKTIRTNDAYIRSMDESTKKNFDTVKEEYEHYYSQRNTANSNIDAAIDAIEELTSSISELDFHNTTEKLIAVIDNVIDLYDKAEKRLEWSERNVNSKDIVNLYDAKSKELIEKSKVLTTDFIQTEAVINTLLSKSEYKKYYNYDWKTGKVTTTGAYDAIVDSDVKSNVKDFIDKLNTYSQQRTSDDGERINIQDTLREMEQAILTKAESFRKNVYDAIVDQKEKEISGLENINSSIQSAAADLVNSIQKNIQKIRQERSNKKTEEELTKMQSRLDFLRMDTSSGNQKTILDLEKQLKEKEQSYTDTLIDQKISELQDQNTEAEKQRKQQIEVMKTQLEVQKDNGLIWNDVRYLIANGLSASGKIKEGSELDTTLKSWGKYSSLSEQGKKDWLHEQNLGASNFDAYYSQGLNNRDYDQKIDYSASGADKSYDTIKQQMINAYKQGLIESINNTTPYRDYMRYDSKNNKLIQTKLFPHPNDDKTLNSTLQNAWRQAWSAINTIYSLDSYFKTNSRKNIVFTQVPNIARYATGGLADYTGPAWLDGTPSSPELVLNQRDTKNFIQLKDILSSVMNNTPTGTTTKGDYYFEINIDVDKITNDYDVDKMVDRIKQQITSSAGYRNVNTINMIR